MTISILAIPDVPGEVGFVARGIVLLLVPEPIDFAGSVRRANRKASEFLLQRFEQFLAKARANFNREVGFIRDVLKAVDLGDLAIQEIAKKEAPREPGATKFLQSFYRSWLSHSLISQ